MKIAISGLGRMGMQIAEKLVSDGHEVVAHNRSSDKVDFAKAFGAQAAYDKQAVVDAFGGETIVLWLMIPADVVESEIREWLQIVPRGSILIDGGNSDYRMTKAHAAIVAESGCVLMDVGTSGGIMGLEHGFSMMVGGEEANVETLKPVLHSLSQPHGGWQYFGPAGAGHYVKMVHNAIEYGVMQSLAEGYRLLREGPYDQLNLAAAGDVWQKGSIIASDLNRLTAEALAESSDLEGIEGYVAESGEARWALETANERGIPMPAIQTAFDVRLASQQGQTNFATKLLAAMRNKFGGHAINKVEKL